MVEEHIHKQVNELPDSLEIGTPSRGGAIKIYCDFNKLDEVKEKLHKAFAARKYAQEKMQDV